MRLSESGLSAVVVAQQTGVSKTCVLNTLRSEGATVRPQGSRGWSRGWRLALNWRQLRTNQFNTLRLPRRPDGVSPSGVQHKLHQRYIA